MHQTRQDRTGRGRSGRGWLAMYNGKAMITEEKIMNDLNKGAAKIIIKGEWQH